MAKQIAKKNRPWSPRSSQSILLGAGALAWIIAVALAATDASASVAVSFAGSGLILIGAACFYVRLRKLGPGGVEVGPAEAVREFRESNPPIPEGASPEQLRDTLLEAVERLVEEVDTPRTDEGLWIPPAPSYNEAVKRTFESYERAINLELVAQDWIEGEGLEILTVKDAAVDFIARRGRDVWAVEVRSAGVGIGYPTPEQLRDLFLRARVWVDEHLGTEGKFERVLATDDVPTPTFRERYAAHGVGIFVLDPSGSTDGPGAWILRPSDARE